MGYTESRGASGKMELGYSMSESASSHKEQSMTMMLEGKDAIVELHLISESSNMYKMDEGVQKSVVVFEIGNRELIDLIKTNGKKKQK